MDARVSQRAVSILRAVRSTSLRARAKAKVRSIWKHVRGASGTGATGSGGIDDSQLPSGFQAPYRRGSRMVRNLWHIPF